jgi:RNA polymerase sigma-70 factor (ECF subfamily)
VLDHLVRAWEDGDTGALVALMTDDVWLRMPPSPLEYQGREQAGRWFATIVFREGRAFRLVPTRANGQPAFGVYVLSPLTGRAEVFDLIVITLAGDRVSAITRFEHGVTDRFGLPPTLPG